MQDKQLPTVSLEGSSDVGQCRGTWHGLEWRIYAEFEDAWAARVSIRVSSAHGLPLQHVADVTVHAPYGVSLGDEVQAVASAILWSRLRRGCMVPSCP